MKPRKRTRSLTDLVPQPFMKQSKIEDFVLVRPPCLEIPAPFCLATAGSRDPPSVGGVVPRAESKDFSRTTVPTQPSNEPTLVELLAQQCFLVAETTASIQSQLDKIITTLDCLVSWATGGCPGLIAQQPDAVARSSLSGPRKSTGWRSSASGSDFSSLDADSHLVLQPKQLALNINPNNGNLPYWGSVQLARGHIQQLLGLTAEDLKKVELLPSPAYSTRVLLYFDNPSTPKVFFRRRSLLRSFGIVPSRVFNDMLIKPLLRNRQSVSIRRSIAPKRPSAVHTKAPTSNAIPDISPSTNYSPISVISPDGVLSTGTLTVPPTACQTNSPQRSTSHQEACPDLISWEEMALKKAIPVQGIQGSLVNKPQTSALGILSTHETDSSQNNLWNLEETQLFDSFCALPHPERVQIIKRLSAVKSKLWSLSLPDKDLPGPQGAHIDLPEAASSVLSPECLIRKSEDPGLIQTLSVDVTDFLLVKQPTNDISTNWTVLRALQPHEQGSPPFSSPLPLSPKRTSFPSNNGCIFSDLKGSLEKINYTD